MLASFVYNNRTDVLSNIWITTILPASFALAILNGASNALNQVTDLKSDKISKPYRPIPRGDIPINHALSIALVLYVISISLSLVVNVMFTYSVSLISMSDMF